MPAAYFSNFPFRGYTLNEAPQAGEYEWVTDIFRRVAPVSKFLDNKRIFYEYQIKDGDSPEIIAHKYYGSVNYHWVVTLLNQITDPLVDWPKNYANFVAYIIDRYGSVAAAMAEIHHYTMTINKSDSLGNSSEQTFIIDETKYDTLTSLVPEVYTFTGGNTVTVTTSRSTVDSYTYELELNEAKRNIILLKVEYLSEITKELELLTAS